MLRQALLTSTPFNSGRNSGQTNAAPAYAASIWSQMLCSEPVSIHKYELPHRAAASLIVGYPGAYLLLPEAEDYSW